MKYVVVEGNPFTEGMKFAGPFDDEDEAHVWATQNVESLAWWIVPLKAPSDGA